MSEIVADFIAGMEAAGVRPIEPIAQNLAGGGIVRFRCEGDKPGRQNAWAVLHLDGTPAGAFGCYRLGVSERWRANRTVTLSPAERHAQRAEWARLAADRRAALDAGQRDAAGYATRLLAGSSPAAADHPYLVRKGISGEGVRQRGDVLLVPMSDIDGAVWNVQRIAPDGGKRFLKGGRTDGLLWWCGGTEATVCVGEGVATMAAVRRATGFPVVAAFSEKNLGPVVAGVAAKHPDTDLIVCADDDEHLVDHPVIKRNLGLDAALAAAAAVGARVAVPPRSTT